MKVKVMREFIRKMKKFFSEEGKMKKIREKM